MVVYDDIQAIYKGRERPVWKQLGIEAQGRTTVLKVNYRNTAQIVAFARRFASDVIGAPGTVADDEHAILLPEDAGRQGLMPEVRQCVSIEADTASPSGFSGGKRRATSGRRWLAFIRSIGSGSGLLSYSPSMKCRSIWPRTTGTGFRQSG